MSGPTSCDAVWDAVLRAITDADRIQLQDVRDELTHDVQDRTINRRLNGMETLGWLEREKPGSHWWHRGPKAQEFLK